MKVNDYLRRDNERGYLVKNVFRLDRGSVSVCWVYFGWYMWWRRGEREDGVFARGWRWVLRLACEISQMGLEAIWDFLKEMLQWIVRHVVADTRGRECCESEEGWCLVLLKWESLVISCENVFQFAGFVCFYSWLYSASKFFEFYIFIYFFYCSTNIKNYFNIFSNNKYYKK